MGGYYGDTYYGGDWYDPSHSDPAYLRSLATVGAKEVKSFESVSRYAQIADDDSQGKVIMSNIIEKSVKPDVSTNYDVNLADLIKPNRAPGKARRLEPHK